MKLGQQLATVMPAYTRVLVQGALDTGSSLGPSREIQTPLVEHKMSVLHSDALASLDDNPCTGISLVTPLDQQSKGQRFVHFRQ